MTRLSLALTLFVAVVAFAMAAGCVFVQDRTACLNPMPDDTTTLATWPVDYYTVDFDSNHGQWYVWVTRKPPPGWWPYTDPENGNVRWKPPGWQPSRLIIDRDPTSAPVEFRNGKAALR